MNIKELIKDGKTATFSHYKENELWYKTDVEGFMFPIPVSDVGNAIINEKEKCMLLMRYIRKYLQTETVTFSHYKENDLWYKTNDGFLFPVPTAYMEYIGTGNSYSPTYDSVESFVRTHKEMIADAKSKV